MNLRIRAAGSLGRTLEEGLGVGSSSGGGLGLGIPKAVLLHRTSVDLLSGGGAAAMHAKSLLSMISPPPKCGERRQNKNVGQTQRGSYAPGLLGGLGSAELRSTLVLEELFRGGGLGGLGGAEVAVELATARWGKR